MPSVIPARPWPDILSSMGSLPWPFQRFIEQIVQSRYAENLFAYTSMHVVVIAQTREIQDGQERLFLAFDPERTRVRMALTDEPAWITESRMPRLKGRKTWTREVAPEKAFATFEKFLRRVGWVPGAGSRDS